MVSLSWIDFNYLTIELKDNLLGSRIDNFYGTRDEFHIKLYKAGQKNLFLSSYISKGITILNNFKNQHNPKNNFIQYLRKYTSNGFIDDVISYEKERILTIKISKKSKDDDSAKIFYIHLEHFMGGQIYFCNEDNLVLKSLKMISDTKIKESNIYSVENEQNLILEKFKFSKLELNLQDSVKELGIGKKYINLIISKFDLSSDTKIKDLEINTQKSIEKYIQNLLKFKLSPNEFSNSIIPFEIKETKNSENKENKESNQLFSRLLFNKYKDELISKDIQKEPVKLTKLKKRLQQQEKSLKKINIQEKELQEKGSLFYEEYQLLSEFQEKIKQVISKDGFKELKSKIKSNEKLKKIISQVDEKNQKISINIEELKKV